MELAIIWLTERGMHDCDVIILSYNSSVVASIWKGQSCNAAQNDSIRRITVMLSCSITSISPVYVSSAENEVDDLSCGCLGPPASHLQSTIPLPSFLKPFLSHV